jgi:hypothetical protein
MESRLDVFENCAGLLRAHGYDARAESSYTPAGEPGPVAALVTCAPEMLVGYAVAMVAEDPSAHLPTRHAKVPKGKAWHPGDPLRAWF